MTMTRDQAVEDEISSQDGHERGITSWSVSRVLYVIAAVVAVTGVVGNALVWMSWTSLYRTNGSPTSWLWGQFLAGIAAPLGIAALVAAAGVGLSRCDRANRQ